MISANTDGYTIRLKRGKVEGVFRVDEFGSDFMNEGIFISESDVEVAPINRILEGKHFNIN